MDDTIKSAGDRLEASHGHFNSTLSFDPVTSTVLDNITIGGNRTVVGYEFYQSIQLAFLCVIIVCIVTGNISVIVAIFMSKSRKSRMNFFILHLAAADLLTGLVTVGTDLGWKTTVEWHAGVVGCKVIRFLQSVLIFASNYILVALSIDRLDAIARPMNFSGSAQRAKALVSVAWTLACILSTPMAVIPDIKVHNGLVQCHISLPKHWHWQLYVTLLALVLFIIPAIIISTCYVIIVIVIWSKSSVSSHSSSRSQTSSKKRGKRNGGSRQNRSSYLNGQESTTSSRGMIPKARIKTIKMTFAIVSAFIICWAPFFLFDLLHVYGHVPRTNPNIRAITIFIQSLATLNSAANPVIYFIFSKTKCAPSRKRQCFAAWSRICCCFIPRYFSASNSEVSTSHYVEGNTTNTKNVPCSETTTVQRRHSITPFVRVTLNQSENAILLRHIPASSSVKNAHHSTYNTVEPLVSAV